MHRSNTVRKTSLKSSRSSVKEMRSHKKYDETDPFSSIPRSVSMASGTSKQKMIAEDVAKYGKVKVAAEVFTFRELATATDNFNSDLLVGEGGFGRVYKGHLQRTDQVVAVKQLDRNGLQGNREFLSEVLTLSLVSHPNLVNLIGYCADGNQRILVYEYMANGSLEEHLFGMHTCRSFTDMKPLDWYTRMKIAAGAAQGLEYLHDIVIPPIIYRDLKTSNILLDDNFNPKLSDFGLAKLGPTGEKDHVSTRVMGTYGYCAPEYAKTGQLTKKSDVYSFGVVFLEIISGRRAIDSTKQPDEQNLISWAKPLFKDRKNFPSMADPMLEGKYPIKGLYQAIAIAAMCLQEEASTRPLIGDVVTALEFLAMKFEENSSEEDEVEVDENGESLLQQFPNLSQNIDTSVLS